MSSRVIAACACLVLARACASSPSKHASTSGRVLSASELPARERDVLDGWHKGGAAWELEREHVLADPKLARFLVDNLVREMVMAYDRSALVRSGEQAGPFERARGELVLLSAYSTPVLVELVAVKDGIVAFLAGDVLIDIGAPANSALLRLLADASGEVRRRAAELLGKLPNAGADEPSVQSALGERIEHDHEWIVRAEAASALAARARTHAHKGYAAAVLGRALGDPDPAVVKQAGAALQTLGEPRAVPVLVRGLERAAQSGNPAGVQALQQALRSLTGVKRDLDVDEWWAWWKQHGVELVPPAGEAPR